MAQSLALIQSRLLTTGLPTFPRTVAKLEHLILEAEAPAQVVASVLATDPSLSALVIGQANAAGHATPLLTQAIRQIGVGVVLTTARSAVPVVASQRKALASLWAEANAAAVMVQILVDLRRNHLRGRWDDETLHMAGLLHDLGHIIALSLFTREYAAACVRLQQGQGPFHALVGEEIGLGVTELVAAAAQHWSLPAMLTQPMLHWREPAAAADGEHSELTAVMHVAHHLVHAAGFVAAGDRFVEPISEWAMSRLDLRLSDLETLLNRLYEQMEELELFEGALGS